MPLPKIGIEQPEMTGVYLTLADINSDAASLGRSPIIVNDLDIDSNSIKAKLNQKIFSYYDGSTISTAPSCECPPDNMTGLVGRAHLGKICSVCKSEVTLLQESDLEPHVWIRAPAGVERLISPTAWNHLINIFHKQSLPIIEWLVNPRCQVSVKDRKALALLESFEKELPNFERSMNYFYRNFDAIISILMASPALKDKAKGKKYTYAELKEYFKKNRDKIFTKYLPIPSRVIYIMEASSKKVMADPELFSLLSAVNCIAGKESEFAPPLKPNKANSLAVNIQKKLAENSKPVIVKKIGKKSGMARQSVFGGKSNYTARCVLSSIPGKHDYRHLYLPWGVAMELFRFRIRAFLVKKGMTARQAAAHHNKHFLKYDPLIDEFFESITAPNREVPYSGESCTHQRNPTLVRLANQYFAIAYIYKDVNIHTVSQSSLTFAGPNADLDGDALNLELATDVYTKEFYSALKPHRGIDDLNFPMRFNKAINLPNPVVATLSAFLNDGASVRLAEKT